MDMAALEEDEMTLPGYKIRKLNDRVGDFRAMSNLDMKPEARRMVSDLKPPIQQKPKVNVMQLPALGLSATTDTASVDALVIPVGATREWQHDLTAIRPAVNSFKIPIVTGIDSDV